MRKELILIAGRAASSTCGFSFKKNNNTSQPVLTVIYFSHFIIQTKQKRILKMEKYDFYFVGMYVVYFLRIF